MKYLARLKKKLSRSESRLQSGAGRDRAAEAHRSRPWLQRWREAVGRDVDSVAREWRRLLEQWTGMDHADLEPTFSRELAARSRFWKLGGWVALLAEAALAAVVANLWLDGGPWIVTVIAVLLTVVCTWLCKLAWAAQWDEAIPQVEMVWAKKRLLWLTMIVLTGIGLFLGARLLPFAGVVAVLVQGLLSLLLPVIAAGAFHLSGVARFPNFLATQYRDLSETRARLDTALQLCELHAHDSQSRTGSFGATAERAEKISRRAAAIGFVMVGIVVGPLPPLPLLAVPPPAAVPESVAATFDVDVWIDTSGSALPEETQRVLDAIAAPGDWLRRVRRVAVYQFASPHDVLQGPRLLVPFPARPIVRCDRDLAELGRYLKAAQRRQDERCSEEQEAALQPFRTQWEIAREQLARAVQGINIEGAASAQTCLLQVLSRARSAAPETLSIVVTDGAHFSCDGALPLTMPDNGGHTSVVLVPSRSDTKMFERMDRRTRVLKELFPKATIVPSFRVEPSVPLLGLLCPECCVWGERP